MCCVEKWSWSVVIIASHLHVLRVVQDAKDAQLQAEQAHTRLQGDLRRVGADNAQLTARLGVATALSESKDVEIEELKAELTRRAGEARSELQASAAGGADESKRLRVDCAQLQTSVKTLVRDSC